MAGQEHTALWLQFKSLSSSGCPKLFYKFSSSTSGFELLLTDLMGIWSCAIEKDAVISQAEELQCPIDPSESPSQFRILMSKIEDSLANGSNHLGLVRPDNEALILRTQIKLPAPLKPLSWTLSLRSMGSAEMAEQILQPCFSETAKSYRQIDHLLQIIRDKDHIISKLLEKIGSTAIDLSLLFPSITGKTSRRNQVTVAEAKKHVAGMSEFNEQEWKSSQTQPGQNTSNLKVLVEGGSERCVVHTRTEHEGWINRLPDPEHLGEQSSQSRQLLKKGRVPILSRSGTATGSISQDSQDAFERQPTPPRLKSNKRKSPDVEPEAASPKKRTRTRFGRLRSSRQSNGANRARSSSNSSTSETEQKRRRASSTTSTETASDSDVEKENPPAKSTKFSDTRNEQTATPIATSSVSSSHPNDKDNTLSPPRQRTQEIQSQQSPTKFGRLSRVKSSTQSSSKSPSSKATTPQKSKQKSAGNKDDGTESDADPAPLPSRTSNKTSSTTSTPSKHRLGKLVSQKRKELIMEDDAEEDSGNESPSPSKRSRAGTSSTIPKPNLPPLAPAIKQSKINREKGSDTDTETESASDNDTTTDRNEPRRNKGVTDRISPQKSQDNKVHDEIESQDQSSSKGTTDATIDNNSPTKSQLTAEEKADMRREMLKKMIGSSSGGGHDDVSGSVAATNKKKKRRF